MEFLKQHWFIKYNSDITEAMFNKLELYLKGFGIKAKQESFPVTYLEFKERGYLRSGVYIKTFCTDNNDQQNSLGGKITDFMIIYGQFKDYTITNFEIY